MSRTFTSSGTTRIRCPIGASPLTSPTTIMSLVRRTTNAVLHVVFYVGSATSGANRMQFAALADNTLQMRCGNNTQVGSSLVVADNWALIGVTKATNATPRFHKYVYDTNTWTHTNAAGTLNDNTPPGTSLYHGDWSSGGDAFGGDIALTACWNVVLTDAQVECLPFNLAAWYQVNPLGIWPMWQDTTGQNVNDLAGSASVEDLETGTVSVATGPNCPIWTPGQAAA